MNRQTRRARLSVLRDTTATMQQEGQGVWSLEIIQPHERLDIGMAALAGNPKWRAVLVEIAKISAAKPPVLCLLCPQEFSGACMPHYVVVIGARVAAPTAFMVNGVCEACAGRYLTFAAMRDALLAYYRQNLMPDARLIEISAQAGTA